MNLPSTPKFFATIDVCQLRAPQTFVLDLRSIMYDGQVISLICSQKIETGTRRGRIDLGAKKKQIQKDPERI